MLSEEKIKKNWNTFASLAENGSGQRQAVASMFEELGDRLAVCPATIKSYPGGLVDQNLKCLKVCMDLNEKFGLELDHSSIVIANLFRNIGMVGDLETDLLIEQESKWHRDNKGEFFKYNSECPFMRTHDRSLFLLQNFGITLTHDEYLAIAAGGGNNEEYKFGEPPLAFAVYAALRFVVSRCE
jgi:hypothetical protein